MKGFVSFSLGFWICMFGFAGPGMAQEEDIFGIERKLGGRKSESKVGNVFRNAISNFSFEISTGGGYHQNRLNFHSLDPAAYPIDPALPNALGEENIVFESAEYAVPVDIGVRLDMFGFFTLGGGYGKEFGRMEHPEFQSHRFNWEADSYTYDKLYATFGLVLYDARRRASFLRWRYRKYSGNNYYMQSELKQRVRQHYPWNFVLEGKYGSLKISKTHDSHLTVSEPFYSLGLRIEREFSEYAKIFVKPSADFSSFGYNMTVMHQNAEQMELQQVKQKFYSVNVGISISIPGTKRCKVPGCGVVMRHIHNGVEYRGSSIWHMQDRKVGQW